MLSLTVAAALFAAFLNASSAVMQRRATGQVDAKQLFRGSILKNVIKNRLWLGGVALQVCGFFAQAVALSNGSLVVVAPLMTTDLLFLLLLIHFGLGIRIRRDGWLAMLAVALGLSGLLAAAQPSGGHTPVELSVWLVVFAAIGTVVVCGAITMRRVRSDALRAAIGGITAGAHFGLTAAVTKLVLEQLQQYGPWHEFVNWPLYALIIVGVSSALSMQSMYAAGSLAISQPALEITEALQGVLIGVWVFGDSVQHSSGALAFEAASAFVLAIGIIVLARVEQIRRPSLSQASKL